MVEGKKDFHGVVFTLISIFIWLPGIWIGFWISALWSFSYQQGFTSSSGVIIFLLWILWMISPLFYVLYHIFGKTPRCPICNTKLTEEGKSPISQTSRILSGQEDALNFQFYPSKRCPKCDGLLETTRRKDVWWCKNCNKFLILFSNDIEKKMRIDARRYECYELEIGSNTRLNIELEANNLINFYIMTPEDFQDWKSDRKANSLISLEKIRYYEITRHIIKDKGIYCFVFDNGDSDSPTEVHIKIHYPEY